MRDRAELLFDFGDEGRAIDQEELGAFVCGTGGNGEADALGGTGDDHDLVGEAGGEGQRGTASLGANFS